MPGRFGDFSLRGRSPIGAGQAVSLAVSSGVSSERRSLRSIWSSWAAIWTTREGAAGGDCSAPDYRALDQHVLDYRQLEGLWLVFGEIYADH